MLHLKSLVYFTYLHLIVAAPQINLYYTDGVNDSNHALQHNCLYVNIGSGGGPNTHVVSLYCMSEFPSKFHIEANNLFPNFTFGELSKDNISSQHLYDWSAPIDVIERYQSYLNQLSTSNDLSLETQIFYNCTCPRFGLMCQYEFYYNNPNLASFQGIVRDFYNSYRSSPTTLTCYTLLKCDRGPYPACLNWSEICDGKVDRLDGAYDEEHCWELEINECKGNEYRCLNGQCIAQSFYRDQSSSGSECIDRSDEVAFMSESPSICSVFTPPSFVCEDTTCEYSPSTSSCTRARNDLLIEAMYSNNDSSVSQDCWEALKCTVKARSSNPLSCRKLCANNTCTKNIKSSCPDMLYFPKVPVFFGEIYFAFRKKNSSYSSINDTGLLYICSNNSGYDAFFNITSIVSFNNTTCFLHQTMWHLSSWSYSTRQTYNESYRYLYDELKRYHRVFNYNSTICNRSNMYQCVNSSKCISIHRLMNNIYDCPYMDDENVEINNTDVIEKIKQTHYKCQASNKYIARSLVENQICDCQETTRGWCEDEVPNSFDFQTNIAFQTICDGFVELLPMIIDGQNETDETDCEQWECNNIYTHCNGIWNCPNGVDEAGCNSFSTSNCSSTDHLCISPETNRFRCLSIRQINDGNVDCLGGTDEPRLCRSEKTHFQYQNNFYCMNRTSQSCFNSSTLCDQYNHCENGDDEQFCIKNRTDNMYGRLLCGRSSFARSAVEDFLCEYTTEKSKESIIKFKFNGTENLIEERVKNTENTFFSSSSIIPMSGEDGRYCHRGLDIRVWLNEKNKSTTRTCLCPPNYYGDRCQYQSQRISVTIKFQALSDSWRTIFAIVISLIDDSDQRVIHSYEQFSYWWIENCKTKFQFYLLYSTRRKDLTKRYSIHIDFYEKVSLNYRRSLLCPVNFPFLPVQRLALFVDIPRTNDKILSCPNDQCVYGRCIRYSDNPEKKTFCQCDQGWTGRYCNISHTCSCAIGSSCIGVSANNRSICLCPLHKFGSRCLLNDTTCQANDNSTCLNEGQCIRNDLYLVSNVKFRCICRKGYSGGRCEIADNQLILSFDKDIVSSQSMFIHFIYVPEGSPLERLTTFQSILDRQDSIIIYWSLPFNLVFIELDNKNYYLAVAENTYKESRTIAKMIHASHHCPHIRELFNQTFVQWNLLRRIKYYHLPCQKPSLNLSCFYDDIHFCLCYNFGEKRPVNCFEFNHTMKFNCKGQSECENGAQCFHDDLECPTRSMCVCLPCYYGRRCQFSTSGFGLSLDAILGYHIRPHVGITQQPFIVKISLALTIVLTLIGFIDGILSMITFSSKIVREVGCGLYLLCSSITTLLTMIILGLKFFILLFSQMATLSNPVFLQGQCHSIDFLLRVCLCMDQWLNACVATERTMTAIKATRFNKKKSKQAAKIVILSLLVIIVGTCIHDPIYRRLIKEKNDDDDDDVKRIWCIITYPYYLQMFNSFMHTFHFIGPFTINLLSAIIFLIKTSRQQANIHKQQAYQEIFRQQIQQHKRLLIAPIVLVILALPRLIITFVSKCMTSINDSWLFLIGYFISFIPTMLTFVVFVLPSKFYKEEFQKTIQRYRTNIQRRLHLMP